LRQPITMVPIAFLLPLVAVASAGNYDANQLMQMMNMMNAMQQAKGWGNWQAPTAAPAPQWSTGSPEDIAAYLKWCEENQVRIADQARQKKLLAEWEKKEHERKEEMKRMAMVKEAAERQAAMESEWKMWEKKLTQTVSFDALGEKIRDMKAHYYYMMVFEFLKFCKCTDFTVEVERFFHHDGFATDRYEEFDLEGLDFPESNVIEDVAQALYLKDQAYQTKAFFGGLANSMCTGARQYFEQVVEWDKQYDFLNKVY